MKETCNIKVTLKFDKKKIDSHIYCFLVKCSCYYSYFSYAQFSCFSLLQSPVSTLTKQRSPYHLKTHVGIVSLYFRIVDVDSSNCDFTMRFLIRIHGLPPGSFNPTSVIVLVRNLAGIPVKVLNERTNRRSSEPT